MGTLSCPHCGNPIAGDPRFAGVVLACPHCGGAFTMPAPPPRMARVVAVAPPAPPSLEFDDAEPDRPEVRKTVLRHSLLMRFLAVVALLGGVFVTVMFFTVGGEFGKTTDIGKKILLVCFGLSFPLMGLYAVFEMEFGHATVSGSGISQHSPVWGTKRAGWDQIQQVRQYRNGAVHVTSRQVTMVFPLIYWDGVPELYETCLRQLGKGKVSAGHGL